MPERKLFAIGDLCLDALQGISNKIEFGEEHALASLNFSVGGNAANFAVISAKMGAKPRLYSAIGTDFAAQFLLKELHAAGVELHLLRSRRQNAYSMILVNKKGERAINSAKNCMQDLTVKAVEKSLLGGLSRQDIVFFSGFFHLEKFRRGFSGLLQKIRKKHALICFDTCFDTFGQWGILEYVPFIDLLFINETELEHVARGNSTRSRINFLFRKCSRAIILKQGARGATLFRRGMEPLAVPALEARAVDTTGAGDAFNAGFAFGLLRNWSLRNCLLAGNFVAARKIREHGLAAPTPKAVERFIAIHNEPELVVEKNYSKMSRQAASLVLQLLQRNPSASIALPTGATPEQMYRLLVSAYKKKKVSFSQAKFFAIDEYAGLPQDDKSSFSYYLNQRFLSKVNAKKRNVFLLDGAARNLKRECAKHEAAIRREGIDLCILGIAPNGHVGFNEPGSCPYGVTRVVRLREETRKKNAKGFPGRNVPKKAVTIGLRTVRDNSRQILLLASGKSKARAVAASLKSKDFLHWPAAALRQHRNFVFVVDRKAAGLL